MLRRLLLYIMRYITPYKIYVYSRLYASAAYCREVFSAMPRYAIAFERYAPHSARHSAGKVCIVVTPR